MLTIGSGEFENIQVLGESKNRVLIVKQSNSRAPVIVKSEETKYESGTRNNVGAMLQFHGTLFSKLKSLPFDTEKLTTSEINALKSCNPRIINGLKDNETWANLLNTQLLYSGTNRDIRTIVKITYIEEIAGMNKIVQKDTEVNLIRDCFENGNASRCSFIVELGQILTVDFFIGNHDRFNINGMLSGPQNVFFQVINKEIKASGIDTYDFFGDWSDLNKTIEQIENDKNIKWPGRILAHGAVSKRDALSKNAMIDILDVFYKGRFNFPVPTAIKNCPFSIESNRGQFLVTLFHKGISEGKAILRKKYNLDGNLSALQSGVRSRWNIINGKY